MKNSIDELENEINIVLNNINENNAIKLFKKLILHIEKKYCDFDMDIETILNLINSNQKLNDTIEFICNKYRNLIINDKIQNLYDNTLFILFIEAYCMLNNIEIDSDLEKEVNNNGKSLDSKSLYFSEISKYKVLSKEEENKLFIEYNKGSQEAKNKIIERNLRLVVSIAKRFVNNDRPLMDISDLISEGNLGLIRAVEKFDVTKGFKFSTYATWWIKQSIFRYVTNYSKAIRVPIHQYERYYAVKKYINKYEQKNGEIPSFEVIANDLNMTIDQVNEAINVGDEPVSLNAYIGNDNDSVLGDFIQDENIDIETEIIKDDLKGIFENIFNKSTLSEREIEVIKLRYGFYDGHPYALSYIGQKYGLSRERIRQIECNALRKLRFNAGHSQLEGFYDEKSKNNNVHKIEVSLKKSLYTIFKKYDRKDIDDAINNLSEESKKLVYAHNYSLPIQIYDDIENFLSDKTRNIDDLLNNSILKKNIGYLSILEQKIFILYSGITGKSYTKRDIAAYLNIPNKVVDYIIQNSYLLYENNIENSKKLLLKK